MAKKRAHKTKRYIQHGEVGKLPHGPYVALGIEKTHENMMLAKALQYTNLNILKAVGMVLINKEPIPFQLYYNIVKADHIFFKLTRAPRYGINNNVGAGVVYPNKLNKDVGIL